MLRASSYVIYVDLPDNDDEMLLVHGYTGAYDRVSRRVATYVRSLEARRPPKPLYGSWSAEPPVNGEAEKPSDEALATLRRRGYLTEMSPPQEEALLRKLAVKIHDHKMNQMPGYIFMPTYDCNLRCAYCFQDHMRTDSKFHHLLRTMSPELVDRIFAGMETIEARHGVNGDTPPHRGIGFFGGEPLLTASRPIVEYIMNKALQMGSASFWAVSNATDLDAYEDLLSPEKISSIQITLDGPPDEHDKRRIYPDGSGSFAKIARNITMALDRGVAISVRMNLDRDNLGELPQLAEVIRDHGWDSYERFSVYAAPIRAENDNVDTKVTMNTWQLDQALAEMQENTPVLAMVDRPDDPIKNHARRLFHDPRAVMPNLRESFCSAHTRMYIFDTFADIYACWERTGDPSIRIGHIAEDGSVELNADVVNLWRSRTVASNPVCSQCRYALHCGGGCAVLALGQSGKYHANFCDGFASRFRASVAEAYMDHTSGVPLAAKAGRVCDQ